MTKLSLIRSDKKLLLVPQWWNGDQDQMFELLRLLGDLEPNKSQYADILLFPRFDTRWHGEGPQEALKSKFDGVYMGRSSRKRVGWPFGPNAVAMDVFKSILEWKDFPYSGVMLIEADCLPLRKTWIKELWQEWNSCDKLVLGHWDGSATENPPHGHMNGNLIFDRELVVKHPQIANGEIVKGGWDMVIWPMIRPDAAPSSLIFSDYQLNTRKNPLLGLDHLLRPRHHTRSDNPLYGQEIKPCWLHGCKKLEGLRLMRNYLLT
jgi:hypothetical protein